MYIYIYIYIYSLYLYIYIYIYIYCRSFPLWISSGNAAKSTDFNEPNQQSMKDLCLIYNWKNIISDKTCCKNP